MQRYRCAVCGYVYDEGAEGTAWGQLPGDWKCPICGAFRSEFEAEASPGTAEEDRPVATASPVARRSHVSPVTIHRVFGYVFLAIYLVLLLQMLPRLWTYQIEFPARTVVHISLGMAIGVMLILKIAVVRYFKRLETNLAPALGTGMLVGSVVLIGISAPAAFREALATSDLFSEENRGRVQTLLTQAGFSEPESAELATLDSLREGQRVLRNECVECHDLRTVLARPRTPESWLSTVGRMAERSTMVNPLTRRDQERVTAYLVALSPGLQQSSRRLREEREREAASKETAAALTSESIEIAEYDHDRAKTVFETKCSQCHTTKIVSVTRFDSEEAVQEIISRMIEQGLNATKEEVAVILRYLTETYVKAE